jgi:hypothetical protein
MPVRCPMCETENGDQASECSSCGKVLAVEADLVEDVEPVPGLEQTLQDPVEVEVAVIAELEQTQLAPPGLAVALEVVPGVEHTQIEADPAAPVNWVAGEVALDRGRDEDHDPRTPAPQDTGICPWCNAPSTGAVCDNCGRRRSRYSAPPAVAQRAANDDTVLCPACFARVATGPRCVECGVPFAVVEL